MPELSRFLGIVIAMYYRDHGPAHFHAIYGEFEATVNIVTGQLNGELPKRALGVWAVEVPRGRIKHAYQLPPIHAGAGIIAADVAFGVAA